MVIEVNADGKRKSTSSRCCSYSDRATAAVSRHSRFSSLGLRCESLDADSVHTIGATDVKA